MRRDLPAPARHFHLAVVTTAVVSAAVSTWLRWGQPPPLPNTQDPVLLAAGLTLATALSATYGDVLGTRRGQREVLVTITCAFHLAAALLLPFPAALVVPAVTLAALQVRRRPALYKQAFNASAYTLGVVVAGPVFAVVRGGSDGAGSLLLAELVACAAYGLVDVTAFAVYVRLAAGLSARESGIVALLDKSSQLTFGVLVAALWHAAPLRVLLLVPIGASLQRAVVFRSVERASRTDPKTGLLNDRAFRTEAGRELGRVARTHQPLSLLMLDLDRLRDINNAHGHLMGDVVIQRVADVLREQLRDQDLACRFGGEEFAVLLPATTADQAAVLAERIRATLAHTPVSAEGTTVPATVSVGIASADCPGCTLEDLIRSADDALYLAKSSGRNAVRRGARVTVPAPRSEDHPPSRLPGR